MNMEDEKSRGMKYAYYGPYGWTQVYKEKPGDRITYPIDVAIEMEKNGVIPVEAPKNVVVLEKKSPEERTVIKTVNVATTGVVACVVAGMAQGAGLFDMIGLGNMGLPAVVLLAINAVLDILRKYFGTKR